MRNYVVPIDFSKSSNLALDYAIARAQRRNAKLILVHVVAANSRAGTTPEDSHSAELVVKAQDIARENARNGNQRLILYCVAVIAVFQPSCFNASFR
jgi:nucleotide-binding universal stress UspA family protein